MKAVILFTVLIATFSANAEKVQAESVLIPSEDSEMLVAIQEARASLDSFLQLSKNPPTGASDFRLKVKVTDQYGSDHMWVEPFRQTPSGFEGELTNEPDYVRNVEYGQEIQFSRQDITDWGYVQDGKQKGGFTVCVMFKHLPAEEVEMYRNDYGFEC